MAVGKVLSKPTYTDFRIVTRFPRVLVSMFLAISLVQIGGLNGDSTADFATSTMLYCKVADIWGEWAAVSPSIMNVQGWNEEKAAANEAWKVTGRGYMYMYMHMAQQLEALCK